MSRQKTTAPSIVQTLNMMLEEFRNDYSEAEKISSRGGVDLVDLSAWRASPAGVHASAQVRHRDDMLRVFFNENVAGASIVIPFRGRRDILSECLESVARQTFLAQKPRKVEVLVVHDSPETEYPNDISDDKLRETYARLPRIRIFRLTKQKGRGAARNVGIRFAREKILFFIDSSMVLEAGFLAEHMLRHAKVAQPIALLGFKENISWNDYICQRGPILDGARIPEFGKDLKWFHVLSRDEAGRSGFRYGRKHYSARDGISYMKISNNFKHLSGKTKIGNRTLPSFFQTNIVSVPRQEVIAVGGFERAFGLRWGLEDSYLGALLFANGIKLVPCPSSCAFNIESGMESIQDRRFKRDDLAVHRARYEELLEKRERGDYGATLLRKQIRELQEQGCLIEERGPAQRTRTGADVIPAEEIVAAVLTSVRKVRDYVWRHVEKDRKYTTEFRPTTVKQPDGQVKHNLLIDIRAEGVCTDHFRRAFGSKIVVYGEETLTDDLRLDDETRPCAIVDMIDGTELLEMDVSLWSSSVIILDPPKRRIVCSAVGLENGDVYVRSCLESHPYVIRKAGGKRELVGRPSDKKYLSGARIGFYGQKAKNLLTVLANEHFVSFCLAMKEKSVRRTPEFRLYNFGGNFGIVRIVDRIVDKNRVILNWGFDAIFDAHGQKIHDFAPAAYIALGAGAYMCTLGGERLVESDLARFLLEPSSRKTYVLAGTKELAQSIVKRLFSKGIGVSTDVRRPRS